ncbi:LemA protein [Elusimicrobium posterum]|uniref:LemA family protein n=1 Tax=Elusimicrobium posterum TaxID=3116653 RepID=UPI003C75D09E
MTALLILIFACVALGIIITFNSLVTLQNAVGHAWKAVLVELQRRYDLVPNLVETVKAAAAYEKNTLEAIIKARQNAIDSQYIEDKQTAEQNFTGAINGLFILEENYPQLKSNENFLQLMDALTETENTIHKARRYYNGCVRDYNNKVESAPSNIVAAMFSFKKAEYFELQDRAHAKAPAVNISEE